MRDAFEPIESLGIAIDVETRGMLADDPLHDRAIEIRDLVREALTRLRFLGMIGVRTNRDTVRWLHDGLRSLALDAGISLSPVSTPTQE